MGLAQSPGNCLIEQWERRGLLGATGNNLDIGNGKESAASLQSAFVPMFVDLIVKLNQLALWREYTVQWLCPTMGADMDKPLKSSSPGFRAWKSKSALHLPFCWGDVEDSAEEEVVVFAGEVFVGTGLEMDRPAKLFRSLCLDIGTGGEEVINTSSVHDLTSSGRSESHGSCRSPVWTHVHAVGDNWPRLF